MSELVATDANPRWGSRDREMKARAILGTVRRQTGATSLTGTWLDIGCGSGDIAAELSRHVDHVIGIDPEPWPRWEDLRRERSNLGFLPCGYRDLAERLGVASIDVVVCNQVYEHVDDPQALVDQIALVLKPGGLCYFAGPNLLWPIEPHVHWPFVHWLPRSIALALMTRLGSRRMTDLDAWSLDLWRLRGLWRGAGLGWQCALAERLQAEAELAPERRFTGMAARLPRIVFRWLLPLSPGFVFLLRKPDAWP